MPISPLFWDLVCGKTPILQDIGRINFSLYKTLEDLKEILNWQKQIVWNESLDEDTK